MQDSHEETPSFFPASSSGRAFIKRVRNNDVENGLLERGTAVLVAVSGGSDSTALLHVFLSLRVKLDLRLGVVHVNYRIRGTEADADEALVRNYCERFSIPFFTFHPKNATGKNEESLRDIRYRFFETIRKREHFDTIAIAHTEDDQAETVLIRLLRGTGPVGLVAMKPRNGSLIRPFLSVPKQDILDFLSTEKIPFQEDSTNADTSILRNRIRHELMPLLEREYRPGIRTTLARTARVFHDLSSPSENLSEALSIQIHKDGISFSRKTYLLLPDSMRAHELRRLYIIVTRTKKFPNESFVREAERLIRSTKGKVRTYESLRLKIEVRGDRIAMIRP
jgi:tRNA(Ile)-lysidine synthase